jgi:hypothetical protein
MKLFTAIYDDARLLGHLLQHYARAGVTDYLIATAPGFAQAVEPYQNAFKITLYEGLDVADSRLGGTSAVSAMRDIHHDDDEWAIIADLDEFTEFSPSIGGILQLAFDEHAFEIRSAHQVSRQSRPNGVYFGQFRCGAKIDQPSIGAESIIHYSPYDIGAFSFSKLHNTTDAWRELDKFIQVDDNRPFIVSVMSIPHRRNRAGPAHPTVGNVEAFVNSNRERALVGFHPMYKFGRDGYEIFGDSGLVIMAQEMTEQPGIIINRRKQLHPLAYDAQLFPA